MSEIQVEGDRITLDALVVDEPALAQLLRAHDEDQWHRLIQRALGVGARGLLTMGVMVDLGEFDSKVSDALAEATNAADAGARRLLEAAEDAVARNLDPDVKTSHLGRALAEFATERNTLLQGLDPAVGDSPSARLMARLSELVGPDGYVESRLNALLDPGADGSALAAIQHGIDARFNDLRELIAREQGRSEEALRGTAKGVAFEDDVEAMVRTIAKNIGGCVVQRTTRLAGTLGAESVVGDFVLTLPDGQRITVEAKNQAKVALNGPTGILDELDRAMANRNATASVCVSAADAFPSEVGTFGVYGKRVLVVEDGSGALLEAAIRWAAALVAADSAGDAMDPVAVGESLARLRAVSKRCSDQKRALTDVVRSVDKVRDGLDAMRAELLEAIDDLARAAGRTGDPPQQAVA